MMKKLKIILGIILLLAILGFTGAIALVVTLITKLIQAILVGSFEAIFGALFLL